MLRQLLYITSLLLLISGPVYSQPGTPILRSETGMHTSLGRRISADASGRLLLTCSDDKTARLWDASTGKLMQVFRIPIGDTREGKIYACAISPDAKTIALGGQTGFEWSGTFSIYILETQTGKIIERISSLPALINDLEFSTDGKWLAAGLGRTAGIRVFETASWKLQYTLEGYTAAVFNLAFHKDGRMAVAAFDGKLRIYSKEFVILKETKTTTAEKLISVAFHPAGKMIAVGYHDSPVIDVRNADDGELLYQPTIENAEKKQGALEVLNFSPDGTKLYGAGQSTKKQADSTWRGIIRSWEQEGRGKYSDLALLKNAAIDSKVLPDGSLAVLGTSPDLGLIRGGEKVIWYNPPGGVEYGVGDRKDFSVDASAGNFVINPMGKQLFRFSINKREFVETNTGFQSFRDSVAGTTVKNWQGRPDPYINGNKVSFLSENERSYSTDVSEDGKLVLIGAAFNIYLANAKGEMIWKTPVPGIALSIVMSTNGKIATVCLSDGTIRWYSMGEGKELLAFIVHRDLKRWILFTPSGYYDASPGAEDLLGWHLNNGTSTTPSFFPVSRFREHYSRPDIIDAVFETYNEKQAISLANQRSGKKEIGDPVASKPLPSIQIIDPVNGSQVSKTSIVINYVVYSPATAPTRHIRILVNGRPVPSSRGAKLLAQGHQQVEVSIPPTDCVITLLAENENGTSPEANLYLKWNPDGKETNADAGKPTLYVLSIGVSESIKPQYRLKFAAKDASDFSATLSRQKGRYYKDVVVKKLADADATKVNILDALQWIQEKTTRNDVAMIFFAGHGLNDNSGLYYMLPVDADAERLRATCINFEEIKQTQSTIEGKVIVFIDACHSGNVMGTGTNINGLINLLTSTVKGAGAITFTSSTGKELSFEDPSWGNGAFTKALLEGLEGAATVDEEKEITYTSLSLYISRRVKKLTGDKQHPTLVPTPNTPDFIIAYGK